MVLVKLNAYHNPQVTTGQKLFQIFMLYDMGLVAMERSSVVWVNDLLDIQTLVILELKIDTKRQPSTLSKRAISHRLTSPFAGGWNTISLV